MLSSELGIAAIIDELEDSWGVTKERVVAILNEKGLYEVGFVRELISSVWDVDKMDYLLRDSQYCGVRYGLYDLDRIIDTITLYDEHPDEVLRLGIDYGGVHAIEGFILARYFMFTQVYFHAVRRAYDLLLTDFIRDLLQNTLGSDRYSEQLMEYIKWTDWKILAEVNERADEERKNLAWRLATRKHPKPVYETGDHADKMVVNRATTKLPEALQEKYPNLKVWTDKATDHPERFRMGEESWPIREKNGSWASLEVLSKALGGLEEVRQFRVYVDAGDDNGLENEIADFCGRIVN